MFDELERIKAVLDLARREINRQRPELALEQLRRIDIDVQSFDRTIERAEYSLLFGEAFRALMNEAAESHLLEALDLIRKLPCQQPDLKLRAHEHLADFYVWVTR